MIFKIKFKNNSYLLAITKLGPFADLRCPLSHLPPFLRQIVFVPQSTRHQDPTRGACDNRGTATNEKDFYKQRKTQASLFKTTKMLHKRNR